MDVSSARKWLPALLLGALVNTGSAELAGSAAPDFVLKSMTGTNLRLSEYRGQVVLVGFWASWCGECRSQLQGLADLYERYQGAGFELLSLSLDSERRQASETVEAIDVGFPVLYDPDGSVGEEYEVPSMPYVVLIDRDGIVRDEFVGYRKGDEAQYLERVRALLSE